MLTGLTIQNVVLIEKLDLAFKAGLTVLTGETGAGKSILLDALGLALGARADQGLVRAGADKAVVNVSFDLPPSHAAFTLLHDQEIEVEPGEPLMLRRSVAADGRSRAFVNDQAVAAKVLRDLGETLVEIHGQHAERGLLNEAGHRALLDLYAGTAKDLEKVRAAHRTWLDAKNELAKAREAIAAAARDRHHLEGAVERLSALAPEVGEEAKLAQDRLLLQQGEKLGENLSKLNELMQGHEGAEDKLAAALRLGEKVDAQVPDRFNELVAALGRAVSEAMEASAQAATALADIPHDPMALEKTEDRLFALREEARRHVVPADELPALLERMSAQLAAIEGGDDEIASLEKKVAEGFAAYEAAAQTLSAKRQKAAKALDKAVMQELPPLKLDKVRFETGVETRSIEEGGADGIDRVVLQVATNPGSAAGSLIKIASGGELSRILLALKVVLAKDIAVPTLVFDEVDKGIGGATADAVGERLQKLGEEAQVLVVTHSPQVAARGAAHFQISKSGKKETTTEVITLDAPARREELARMLSGASVSDEARAAADQLLDAG